MKKQLFVPIICVFLWSCNGCNNSKPNENFVEIKDVKTTNDFQLYSLKAGNTESKTFDTIALIRTWNTCSINEPRQLGTLNSGSKKFVYVLDKNNQATGSLFGLANLNLDRKEKIAIVDFVQYRDTICTVGDASPNGSTIRLAAGVRLFIKIKKSDNKVKVEIPSKVAAGAEFGLSEATFSLETIGFANDQTKEIMSNLGESFDVESYVKIMNAVSQVMKVMKDTMIVNPVRIPN